MAPRRFLRWLAAAGLVAGLVACSSKRARESAAKDLEALSGDQCLKGFVTDKDRDRLVAKAHAGAITQEQVDAYIDEIRKKKQNAQKINTSVYEFCVVQRSVWGAHFGRHR